MEEITEIFSIFQDNFSVPDNFCETGSTYQNGDIPKTAFPTENPQTREFCHKLGVTDPLQDIIDSNLKNPLLDKAADQSFGYSDYSSLIPSQLDISMNRTSIFDVSRGIICIV